eukprot:TRINITY_DN2366_c0_g1_i1.p2 TRINITY_DN2366_c0_g1~~TRINITY_DN2366_c0_g1_i1.p2  ORF type:complete len:118 (+),score=36.48 TRINITY_DN2366_c0_g1_i1:65-418(+)
MCIRDSINAEYMGELNFGKGKRFEMEDRRRRQKKVTTDALTLLFKFFNMKIIVEIWLYENKDLRFEGRIMGFDEYMNMVLDDAIEVNIKKGTRQQLGRILLKGENITLVRNVQEVNF